ncbi:MAG: hypothetical protein OIF58_12775, partial [Cohaesibacter sp.]|nr:hypothetical protein [Cohaesibacter sp.]
MASVAIMAGGALLNAAAFIGGNYLARFLSGDNSSVALEEKVRHDKALESYQEAYAKYQKDRTELLDWIAANERIKEQAKQNFTDTDYAFKLYNQVPPDKKYCLRASQSSLISISQASSNNKASSCSWALAPLRSVMRPFVFFELFITIPLYDGHQTRQGIL